MTKHTYTEAEAPTNTGSVSRPARLNLRLDCQARARTFKAFIETREMLGLPKDANFADIWEKALLPLCEHALWHLRESPTAVRRLVRSLYSPLPVEDYARNRYKAMKERFEPKPKAKQGEAEAKKGVA